MRQRHDLRAGLRIIHARMYAGKYCREGCLVAADSSNHRVQILRNCDGIYPCTIGSYESGACQFHYPSGVAFDVAGHIAVVNYQNHRLHVLRNSDGAYVRNLRALNGTSMNRSIWGFDAVCL